MMTNLLNTSIFLLRKKERTIVMIGYVDQIGTTKLAGAILRAVYRVILELLLIKPAKQKNTAAPLCMLNRAFLLFSFSKDIIHAIEAAVKDIKAPTGGGVVVPSPIFMKIGLIPHTKPAPIPGTRAFILRLTYCFLCL